MSAPIDAIGAELHEGDVVAYVHRSGSQVHIEKRIVVELDYRKRYSYERADRWMARTSVGNQWIEVYNLVRVGVCTT